MQDSCVFLPPLPQKTLKIQEMYKRGITKLQFAVDWYVDYKNLGKNIEKHKGKMSFPLKDHLCY